LWIHFVFVQSCPVENPNAISVLLPVLYVCLMWISFFQLLLNSEISISVVLLVLL
jgi:hypothetical protein